MLGPILNLKFHSFTPALMFISLVFALWWEYCSMALAEKFVWQPKCQQIKSTGRENQIRHGYPIRLWKQWAQFGSVLSHWLWWIYWTPVPDLILAHRVPTCYAFVQSFFNFTSLAEMISLEVEMEKSTCQLIYSLYYHIVGLINNIVLIANKFVNGGSMFNVKNMRTLV